MRKPQTSKVASAQSETVKELPRACDDETAAVEFIEKQRWGSEPACPKCGDLNVYQMKDTSGARSSRYLWRCRGCKDQFTARTGTVFEDSRIPLKVWCYAFWKACSSKKGVSALQIKRETGLSYKSALFLMHRIRFAMSDEPAKPEQLTGIVETDATYVGGKPRHERSRRAAWSKKPPVLGAVERGGDVRASVVEKLDALTLSKFVYGQVSKSARLMTDEATVYRSIGKKFQSHETVTHSKKEYVRGEVHTNSIESFWAIVKRAMYGTHHAVSRKHLHRYITERSFVFNMRHVDDGARTIAAIKGAEGKRLTYRATLE